MGRSSGRRLIHWIWPWKTRWKVTATLTVTFLLVIWVVPLPNPLFNNPYATVLRASNGQVLSAFIADDEQWRFPPLDSIPQKFTQAVRLKEDEHFYYHPGFNPFSIVRALIQNVRSGKIVSGGSTLTMQTVRMAYLNQPRTYVQKLIELMATLKLELLYSKQEILEAYTNNAPFGGNVVGLSAASWRYYGRSAHQLSWAETAALAVLPNNPSYIFPGRNEDTFLRKRNRLLDKLSRKGFLDADELFLSKEEALPHHIKHFPNQAYHLLHRSIAEGKGGTDIVSTLDAGLQLQVARKVNAYSQRWSGNQVHNAAALVIEIKSGNALAYVGNSVSTGSNGQHVDIITSQRSPGSLLKPILYAAALDEGLILPQQLLPDIPLFYKGFSPKNFDKKFRGAIRANNALTSSLNVPFVHLLIKYGYEKFHLKLQQMGMASLRKPANHYGLSLILGGAETTLWELTSIYAGMARAYQNFPNREYRKGYTSSDYFPNRYTTATKEQGEPEFEEFGYLQTPSLGFTFRAMQQLNRPDQEAGWQYFSSSQAIAWKTGTSFGFRDGWAIGISNKHVVGVWMGNADGEGRPGLTGVQAAAPLLFQLFELLPGKAKFDEHYGTNEQVCAQSGMRAGENCPQTSSILLPAYMASTKTCTYHRLIHLNKEQTFQVNSNCYELTEMQTVPWFVLPPVQSWYYQKRHPQYKKLPPFSPSCQQTNGSKLFELIYPRQFTKVHIPIEQDGTQGKAVFEAAHENREAALYWHLDNAYIGVTTGTHQMGIQASNGTHMLTLVDDQGNELQQKFEVVN